MAPPAAFKPFDPCREIPNDPFQEKIPLCKLEVPKAKLVKLNGETCVETQQGYRCKDRFFPTNFTYLPTLFERRKGTLVFGNGSQIKEVLLPTTPLERAEGLAYHLSKEVRRDPKKGKNFDQIVISIEKIPEGIAKDRALQVIALEARNVNLIDIALSTARKIRDPQLLSLTLSRIAVGLTPPNIAIETFDEAWEISSLVSHKANRDLTRLIIAQSQAESGLFYEAFGSAFLIQDPEKRGSARVAIAKVALDREMPLLIPSWLLQLAEADYKQLPRKLPHRFQEIREIRARYSFISTIHSQREVNKAHQPNLASLQIAYSEVVRFDKTLRDPLQAALQKAIDRLKGRVRQSNGQPSLHSLPPLRWLQVNR